MPSVGTVVNNTMPAATNSSAATAIGRKPTLHRCLPSHRTGDRHDCHDGAGEIELQRRLLEHLLGVQRQGEQHPIHGQAYREDDHAANDQRPQLEHPQRHRWRPGASLDDQERAQQGSNPKEPQDGARTPPAALRRVADSVDQQPSAAVTVTAPALSNRRTATGSRLSLINIGRLLAAVSCCGRRSCSHEG